MLRDPHHPSRVLLISDNAQHRNHLLSALAKRPDLQPSGRVLGAVVDRFHSIPTHECSNIPFSSSAIRYLERY